MTDTSEGATFEPGGAGLSTNVFFDRKNVVWLRDESLEDLENLPPSDVIAQEIVEDLEAALAEFSAVAESLGDSPVT